MPKLLDVIRTIAKIMMPIIARDCKQLVPAVDANLIQSMLNLLSTFFGENGMIDLRKANLITNPDKAMLTYVAFSLIWSLGANIHDSSRGKFAENFKLQIKKKFPEFPDGDIYEFGIDKELNRLEPWDNQKPEFHYDPQQSFFDILVPTSDTVKYKYLLGVLLDAGHNVLITGETGVGKSVVVKDFLATAPDHIVSAAVNFSGKTSTKNLQDAFEGNLEAKRKTLLGPPGGKKMVFFIDDINMPQLDTYGSQPPCELLRQAIDNTGFYDTKKLIFKQIKDTRFACACAPPGGGRNAVTPRLFRHFNMVWVPDLSEASMKVIFTSILRGFLDLDEAKGLNIFAEPVIRAQVDLYLTSQNDFLPTPAKCHYTFNLRDMSKVVQGILMIDLKNLSDKASLVHLWIHEAFRVFRDRLIDAKDRKKFSELAHEKLEAYLDMEWQLADYEDILFGNYENAARQYNRLSEVNALIPRLDTFLELYNADNSPMNLVFFGDCIQHLSRIARILSQQRGNAMLVGVGGSGRRSMARLGGSINEQTTFSIEITKSYREKEFHEDIRGLLRRSAIDNEP
jgi:dynein heavy chain